LRDGFVIFIDQCEKCNRYRKNTHTWQGQLKYAGVTAPWQKVHIDLMGRSSSLMMATRLFLTVICSFFKYLIAISFRDKSAFSVARALVRQVFLVALHRMRPRRVRPRHERPRRVRPLHERPRHVRPRHERPRRVRPRRVPPGSKYLIGA
jgi:hypothetical protein